jgi:hypothetical protein
LPDRPLDYQTIFIDVAAATVAVELRDLDAAAGLLARLAPWAGRWANAGTAAGSLGLVELALGRLHAVLGHDDDARRWFAAAVAGHEQAGSPAWLARSLLHQGRYLRSQGDDVAAQRAFLRAAGIAEEYALVIVARQVAEARA